MVVATNISGVVNSNCVVLLMYLMQSKERFQVIQSFKHRLDLDVSDRQYFAQYSEKQDMQCMYWHLLSDEDHEIELPASLENMMLRNFIGLFKCRKQK